MNGNDTVSKTWNLVITNDGASVANAVNYGDIFEVSGTKNKIHFIMSSRVSNGSGGFNYLNNSQSFAGDNITFSGGVTLQSGAIYFNYSATGANVSHGDLKLQKVAGASDAKFGNVTTIKGNGTTDEMFKANAVGGTFAFSNLVVSDGGGTIAVRFDFNDDGALLSDKLSFSGTATGSGKVVIEMLTANGNTGVDDYVECLIVNNTSEKIISWAGEASDAINFETTDLYKIYNYDGIDYVFTALNKEDGLYISYLQVPEPSTVAVIFGVIALCFGVWRRSSSKK